MVINEKIVKKIKNNDYDTIKEIYTKHYKLVKYIISKYIHNDDADDLVQEVFVKVFKKIDTYNMNYEFHKWIAEITKNTAIDYLKKKDNSIYKLIENQEEIIDFKKDSNINDSLDKKIRSILNDEEYKILVYKIYLNYKFKDIAKILNIKVSIVSSKYFRAIKKLKEKIKKEDFYD